jgi:DNA repair exonuclease SbcCD ATPase subunit
MDNKQKPLTLQEAKNQVAKSYGFHDWDNLLYDEMGSTDGTANVARYTDEAWVIHTELNELIEQNEALQAELKSVKEQLATHDKCDEIEWNYNPRTIKLESEKEALQKRVREQITTIKTFRELNEDRMNDIRNQKETIEALQAEIERLNERLDKDINALLHLGMAKDEQIERLKNIIKDGKLGN